MLDLNPCKVCLFEYASAMSVCPLCGWPRSEGDGGVREPADPPPAPLGPEKEALTL